MMDEMMHEPADLALKGKMELNGFVQCSRCHRIFPEKDVYCPTCGAWFDHDQDDESPRTVSISVSADIGCFSLWLSLCVTLFLITFVILFLVSFIGSWN